MENKNFSIKEAYAVGWEKTKKHFFLIIGALVVMFFVSSAISLLGEPLTEDAPLVGLIFGLVSIAVMLLFGIGYYTILLKSYDGQDADLSDLFLHFALVPKYAVVVVLYALMVVAGMVLLIIPGLYFLVKYWFVLFVMVDTKKDIMTVLKTSAGISRGVWWKLFGFYIVIALTNTAGILLAGVGLLVTIPLTGFATVHVYRQLEYVTNGAIVKATDHHPLVAQKEV